MFERCHQHLHLNLAFAVFSITIGSSFQNGFHLAVMNPAGNSLRQWLVQAYKEHHHGITGKDTLIYWLISSAYPITGLIGAASSHLAAKRFGSKRTLLASNGPSLLAALLLSLSSFMKSWEMFLCGKMFLGFSVGLTLALCPIYLIEIAPEKVRAPVTMINELVTVVSVVCALSSGLYLGERIENWPFIFSIPALPAILQICTLHFCPESPRYLLFTKMQHEAAYKALMWLRNSNVEVVEEEFAELLAEKEMLKSVRPKIGCRDLLMNIELRTPWVLCVMAIVGQQFCGILVTVTYSTEIFSKIGLSQIDANIGTLCIGASMFLVTVGTLFLIECAGRRLLLLISYIGMALCTTILSISLEISNKWNFLNYFCVILFVLFVMFYSLGAGGVTWVLLPELIPHSGRTLAAAMALPFVFLAGFSVLLTYRVCEDYFGAYTLIIFVVCDFLFFVFFYIYLPETLRKSYREMISFFRVVGSERVSEDLSNK